MSDVVLYFVVQQGDELISFGTSILDDLARGLAPVVVCVGRGDKVWVGGHYVDACSLCGGLSTFDAIMSRDRALIGSCRALGLGAQGIVFLHDRAHTGTVTPAWAAQVMRDLIARRGARTVRTYCPTDAGASPDGCALGVAALSLLREGSLERLSLHAAADFSYAHLQGVVRGGALTDAHKERLEEARGWYLERDADAGRHALRAQADPAAFDAPQFGRSFEMEHPRLASDLELAGLWCACVLDAEQRLRDELLAQAREEGDRRVREESERYESSNSWRVGRIVTKPVRAVLRRGR